MKRFLSQASLIVTLTLCGTATLHAQSVRDDVGYTRLNALLGSNTPNGSSVTVGVIEPAFAGSSSDPVILSWMPQLDRVDAIITDKTIFDRSGGSPGTSSHATQVAKWLFSNKESIAPGIQTADFYHLNHFIGNELIPRSNGIAPNRGFAYRFGGSNAYVFKNRINNFSAIGDTGTLNSRTLRRFDWATATEDVINVISAGNSSPSPTVFSSSFNGIYVGITAGTSSQRAASLDQLYNGTRRRPDIVAPMINTSRSTAVASSIAASLLDAARNPNLSSAGTTNSFRAVQNAERSETMKAIIMAGADRQTQNVRFNTKLRNPDGTFLRDQNGKSISVVSDITNYRDNVIHHTDNGLDTRYGAGQANVLNSYNILAGGEQDSREDGGSQTVSLLGFDYDEAFGEGTSQHNPNSIASYLLPTLAEDAEFFLTLAWNLDVMGSDGLFVNALLYDLDLWLYDVTSDEDILIDFSASSNANTETIAQILLEGHDYEFRVTTEKNVTALLWDYGIAWRTEYLNISADELTADALTTSSLSGATSVATQAVPIPAAGWLFITALVSLLGLQRLRRT